MRTITINVTQEDIDKGIKNSCFNCALALSAKRALEDANLSVGAKTIFWVTKLVDFNLPQVAIDFIKAFDTNQPVSPFTFDLTLAD